MAGEGVAGLVAALSGGGGIEQAAYDKAMQRMLDQKNTQAQIDQRVQEAYMLARQNEAQEGFGKLFASVMTNPERQPNAPFSQNELAALIPQMLAAGSFDFSDVTSGVDKLTQTLQRGAINEAAQREGFTDVNRAALTFDPQLVESRGKLGDLVVEGLYSNSPKVDEGMTNRMAAASAAGDKSGTLKGKEQEIAYYTEVLGLPLDEAIKQAYDKKAVRVDSLGNIVNIDEITGTADSVVLGADQPKPDIAAPPPGGTMMDLADIGTGVVPIGSDIWARTVSLLGASPDFGPSEAIGQLRSMALQVINAQRQNPRFSEGERKDLIARFNVEPGLLRSKGYLKSQLQALRQTLEVKARQAEADANDRTLTTTQRGVARNAAREARNAIALIGGTGATGPAPEIVDAIRAELEGNPEFQSMTPEEQQLLIMGRARARSGGQ